MRVRSLARHIPHVKFSAFNLLFDSKRHIQFRFFEMFIQSEIRLPLILDDGEGSSNGTWDLANSRCLFQFHSNHFKVCNLIAPVSVEFGSIITTESTESSTSSRQMWPGYIYTTRLPPRLNQDVTFLAKKCSPPLTAMLDRAKCPLKICFV